MLKGFSAICLTLLALTSAFAQDKEDVSNPAEQAYTFAVTLKLLDRDGAVVDTRDATKVTFSGKPIAIKLDGRTIQGLVVFTVYAEKNKPTILLAQAQLLVKEEQTKEGQWVTILQSIPFVLGDKIEFYPLGKENFNANNILFELKIEYYVEPSKNEAPRRDAGDTH